MSLVTSQGPKREVPPALVEVRRITGEPSSSFGRPRGEGIRLRWSNGEEHFLSSTLLRTSCPCATCRAERGDESHDRPLTGGKALLTVVKADTEDQLDLKTIWPVGNYALGMAWGDNHSTGIYSFSLLWELSRLSGAQTRATDALPEDQ